MLIDEIIEALSDTNTTLTNALLKTQVLLHKLGRKDLAEWVKWELNGYPDGSELPDYRILPANVLGHVANIAYRRPNSPLPLHHLKEEIRDSLETMQFGQSLTVIENLASGDTGFITRPIPLEYNHILGKTLGNGYEIEQAWSSTPIQRVKGIFTQVRSRLLEFLLELRDTLGDNDDEGTMKEKAATPATSGLFQNAIFGSNTTILVGDNGSQHIQVMNVENNISALMTALKQVGIPDENLVDLQKAIDADTKNGGKPDFDGETGKWYTGLLGRAAKGTLNVGVDVISSTVAKILAAFMGAPIP